MSIPDTAAAYMRRMKERVRELRPRRRIVFPEGADPRVISAAARLSSDELVDPVLIGPAPRPAPAGVRFLEPGASPKLAAYTRQYYERRRAKGITEMEAAQIARRPLYFSALMVAANDADGFVGGAVNTTAETVRAALHCIGTAKDVKTVSSVFIMAVPDPLAGHNGLLAFADCAVVIEPAAVELAEIAITTARNTQALMDVEPVVALLSYSTKGSGKGKRIDTVVEALRIVKARAPHLHVDGELQADAALVEAIGRSKAPGSTVAGRANTLIFPDLMSGNICYKMVERLAGAAAIGPFLQGLARPANDLSRGCSEEDVYNVAIVTALQTEIR
ncbi:MAG: Phosphate acetyltransferase [Bryobacteraceae bacterium]|nr:Phosphate acetyltransferase [Bryobacteraceae bacterium]